MNFSNKNYPKPVIRKTLWLKYKPGIVIRTFSNGNSII